MKTLKSWEWLNRAAAGKWLSFLMLAVGTQCLFSLASQAALTENDISDSDIALAIDEQLALEAGVSPNYVDVSSMDGIVTLSGSVDNLLAKDRAVKIAQTIRGVRGVIDQITVTPASRPDADIRRDILMALLQDPATESYQIGVSVQNAVATLTGSVGSYVEKQLVERIAKGVEGTREIHNEVQINNLAKRTDREIAADVQARLYWDIWLNGSLINAVAHHGKVTLTGTVGSAIAKERAFDDAYVNGVTSVDDSGLIVQPWARNPALRQADFADGSDSQIKQAVLAALSLDPRVAPFSPRVDVKGGVIILKGTVGNLKAKTVAGKDAMNIVGVGGVENFLKVKPLKQMTDAEMAKQLKAALAWDALLGGPAIDADVIHGVAYLSGDVNTVGQRAEAQDVASRISGVLWVRNRLKVEPDTSNSSYYWPGEAEDPYDGWLFFNRPPYTVAFGVAPYLSDKQIKRNIERAFMFSPFVNSENITVSVRRGVVTLTGSVASWIGWREADEDAVRSGAADVIDRIQLSRHAR